MIGIRAMSIARRRIIAIFNEKPERGVQANQMKKGKTMSEQEVKDAIFDGEDNKKRITMSDGTQYTVHAGNIVVAGRTSAVVVDSNLHIISHRHITSIASMPN